MRSLSCDVLVVGAGPVGCIAAKTASECGANVILLEEHPQVGSPVFCAEGLSLKCIKDSGLEAKTPIVCQDITETRIIAPNKNYIKLVSPKWSEFIINRDLFDLVLSEKAVKSGVHLMTNTRALTVTKKGDTVNGVIANYYDTELKISAKVVVGADGHASVVRITSGLSRWFSDVYTCAQFTLGGLDLNPQVKEVLLGGNIAPRGYAWVFPKSREVANVGLGVRRIHETFPIEYLKKFVESDARFRSAEIQMVTGGICPASGTLNKIVDNGVMIVGDAAGQLMPLTGAGVQSGIRAGRISGEVAAQSVKEGDVSASRLSMYERRFDGEWGELIRNSRWVREHLDRLGDEDLNRLPRIIGGEDLGKLASGTAVKRTIAKTITRSPMDVIILLNSLLFPRGHGF